MTASENPGGSRLPSGCLGTNPPPAVASPPGLPALITSISNLPASLESATLTGSSGHWLALVSTAREHGNGLRERVAREWIELQALRYTNYRSLSTYERTGMPGPEGSAIKLRWSEQNQRLTKLGRELLGPEGILDDGWWHYQQLRSRGNTIEAGTSEVLRNIVAERVLGLPRSR